MSAPETSSTSTNDATHQRYSGDIHNHSARGGDIIVRLSIGQDARRVPHDHKPAAMTFEDFADRLSTPQVGPKGSGGFYLSTVFAPCKRGKNDAVELPCIVNVDLDFGQWSIDLIRAALPADTAWIAYSTASHTVEEPRFRVVLPLSMPLPVERWTLVSRAVMRLLGYEEGNVEFDRCTEKIAQPMYLPTIATPDALFEFEAELDSPALSAESIARMVADEQAREKAAEDLTRIEREHRNEERRRRTERFGTTAESANVIEAFNAAHPIEGVLEGCGYRAPRAPGGKWLSPNSSKGVPAVKVWADEGRFYSHHASDQGTEYEHGDAFDLFRLYEHSGNWTSATRAAAERLGIDHRSQKMGRAESSYSKCEDVSYDRESTPDTENLTDLGNARRFRRLHGDDLRYVYPFGRWYVWDEVCWREDTSGEVMRRATSVPMDLYGQASESADSARREELSKYAHRTESEKSLKALISLAQSERGVSASPDEFDADPWSLNTPKGIVDLRTGDLAPHARSAMCTRVTGTGFDPGARSELWESCLETWIPDSELRAFVKRAIGYSLIGEVLEQVLFIMWGTGANGKSVFFEIIRKTLGSYALNTPAETLVSNRGGGIPNDVARLKGARFVSASESEENRNLAEAKIKALTGGDIITARFMRGEFFEFEPTFAVLLSTNHKPVIRGNDLGIWRRIRLIPFTVTIPESKRDPKLLQRLEAELPAILAWAIEGCLEYQKRGLDAPKAVTEATDSYRRESDVFGDFLEECCTVGTDRFASSSALYNAYREWSKAAGEEAVTKTAFGKKLTERGFDARRTNQGRGWCGIALGGHDA